MIRLEGAAAIVRRGDTLMFDSTSLFLSLITGGIGFVLMAVARKTHSWPYFVAGLAYMVYPYFVDTALTMIIVGIVLAVGLWLAIREGW